MVVVVRCGGVVECVGVGGGIRRGCFDDGGEQETDAVATTMEVNRKQMLLLR